MKNVYIRLMAALVALVWFCPMAKSAVVLDQSQTATDTTAIRVYSSKAVAQTFTAGLTGYLSLVRLGLSSGADQQAPATIRILGTVANLPNSANVLWSSGLLLSGLTPSVDGWYSIDTSSASISITAGSVYAIELSSTDPDVALGNPDDMWSATGVLPATDFYAGGKLFQNTGSGWVDVVSGVASRPTADAMFQTYVVPEPSVAVFLGCFGTLIFLRRLRR